MGHHPNVEQVACLWYGRDSIRVVTPSRHLLVFKLGSPMNYLEGSVWRKWDLHVHTPASIGHHYSIEAKIHGTLS